MENAIIDSQLKFYDKQARRVAAYLKGIFPQTTGESYPQIITGLNAVYKKEHTDDELKKIITDGDGDGSFADAFVFTRKSVDIFDFKISSNLKLVDIRKIRVQLENLLLKRPVDFDDPDIRRIKTHLMKYHSPRNKIELINIYIVREKFSSVNEQIDREIKRAQQNNCVKIKLISYKDIVDLLLEKRFTSGWEISKTNLDLLADNNDYLIINIPLRDLLQLYNDYVEKNEDLFDKNIRSPQKKRKFSEGILYTLRKYPKRFFIFHNGITITAVDINKFPNHFRIIDPQVVNGAQTLGNLLDKYQDNLNHDDLKAKVLCKIIKGDQEMIDFVCETSNTQKEVKTEDLRTNDYFQKELGLLIKSESNGRYEYVRKERLEKSKIPIKYTKLFQWSYAALFENPAEAKNAKKRLFENSGRGEYENIKNRIKNNIPSIIKICDIGLLVDDFIKKITNKSKKSFLTFCNFHIIAGLFLLDSKDKEDIEKIYKLLYRFSRNEIKRDKNLNYNKIFTKSDTAWRYLKSELTK